MKFPVLAFEEQALCLSRRDLTSASWHQVFDGSPVYCHPRDLWGYEKETYRNFYKVRRVFLRKEDAFQITILNPGETVALKETCYHRLVWGEMIAYIFSNDIKALTNIHQIVQRDLHIGSGYCSSSMQGVSYNSPSVIATSRSKMSRDIWSIELDRNPRWQKTGETRKITPADYFGHMELGNMMEIMLHPDYKGIVS